MRFLSSSARLLTLMLALALTLTFAPGCDSGGSNEPSTDPPPEQPEDPADDPEEDPSDDPEEDPEEEPGDDPEEDPGDDPDDPGDDPDEDPPEEDPPSDDPGDDPGDDPEPEPEPAPVVSAIAPTEGRANEAVTITGEHFGESAGEVRVKFNGTAAAVLSASATEIVAEVPKGALTGPVAVEVAGDVGAGPELTYLFTRYEVTTYLDGLNYNQPLARLAEGPSGALYLSDMNGGRIFKIAPGGSSLDEFADGLGYPYGIVVDEQEAVYVAVDDGVKKIEQDGTETLLASGLGGHPTGLTEGPGGALYVYQKITPTGRGAISKIEQDETVTTVVESEALPGTGEIGLAVGEDGAMYVSSTEEEKIFKVTPQGAVSTLAGGALDAPRRYGRGRGL